MPSGFPRTQARTHILFRTCSLTVPKNWMSPGLTCTDKLLAYLTMKSFGSRQSSIACTQTRPVPATSSYSFRSAQHPLRWHTKLVFPLVTAGQSITSLALGTPMGDCETRHVAVVSPATRAWCARACHIEHKKAAACDK